MKNTKYGIHIDDRRLAQMTKVLNTLENHGDESVHLVLNDIGTLIIGGYAFGINVLPFLRVLFPEYEWTCLHRENNEGWEGWKKKIGNSILSCDFVWKGDRSCVDIWVVARKKGLEAPRRIFGNGFIDEVEDHEDLSALFKEKLVKEIWPEWTRGRKNLFVDF